MNPSMIDLEIESSLFLVYVTITISCIAISHYMITYIDPAGGYGSGTENTWLEF